MIGTVIWIAVITIIVVNAFGKSKGANKTKQGGQQTYASGTYQQPSQPAGTQTARTSAQQVYRTPSQSAFPQQVYHTPSQSASPQRVVTDADRARLEEYRRKKAASGAYVPSEPVSPNQNTSANRQRNAAQPNIVERAKANSRKYAEKDETLSEMEREHKHSERVGSAVAGYVERERKEHRKMHEEPAPRVEETSLLGSVEDLMTKGFDGSLSFERDFIGEAEDMLAAFTMSR